MKDIFQNIDQIKMEQLVNSHIHDSKFLLKKIYSQDIIDSIICEERVLRDIVTRIEKRRYYFYVFYNRKELGDINEAALFCFWVIKLMPFKQLELNNADLNTKIGYSVLINTLNYVSTYDKAYKKKKLNFSTIAKRNLLYSLKYRDLSKEAIMAIAESLIS